MKISILHVCSALATSGTLSYTCRSPFWSAPSCALFRFREVPSVDATLWSYSLEQTWTSLAPDSSFWDCRCVSPTLQAQTQKFLTGTCNKLYMHKHVDSIKNKESVYFQVLKGASGFHLVLYGVISLWNFLLEPTNVTVQGIDDSVSLPNFLLQSMDISLVFVNLTL